ncbi:MAG TPA: hypothetical protein VNA22_06315 [Pyrinomonadaceae bacterium]|nr:hypothetical protein [Pyrinomonadaceae bacterium]
MNKVYLGLVVILACVTLSAGQMQKQTPGKVSEEPRKSGGSRLVSGTNISGELQKTLDVNKTQVGDEVVLRTTQSIKYDGQVVVPKGSTLVGRVTEVQRRTRDNAQSKLAMIFDRIQGKQLSMPLNATVVAVSNVAARGAVDDSVMADTNASSQTTGTASRRSSGGGGLLGGVGGTVGGLVGTTTQTVGSVANTTGQTLGNTAGTATRTVNGLSISAEANGSANSTTTLSSANKNLRFAKGSTFHLRVAN